MVDVEENHGRQNVEKLNSLQINETCMKGSLMEFGSEQNEDVKIDNSPIINKVDPINSPPVFEKKLTEVSKEEKVYSPT